MKIEFSARPAVLAALAFGAASAAPAALAQGDRPVYRCPGNPVLYTDALTAREARDKGCRTLEGAPVTVIAAPKPRAAPAAGAAEPSGAAAARSADQRVDAAQQRARDSDARRILEAELAREQERLAELQKEYNNGEPERQGNERNYQKYLDRVEDLKTSLARKESDIAAIKRELAKLAP